MDSRQPPDFAALIGRISSALRDRELPFMLIGGQAVLLHGQPRLTEDIDITLGVKPEQLPSVLDACRGAGLEILPEDPREFVRDTFVLPARDTTTSIRIDLIFSSIPYERQAIDRAVEVNLAGVPVPFASAEDLILHKLFAGRPRDLEDVGGVVLLKGDTIEWEYVEHWVAEFSTIPGREHLLETLKEVRSTPR